MPIGPQPDPAPNWDVIRRDLAKRVKELTGSKSEIALIPYDKAYEAGFEDMPRRVPDISRISGLVGYKPTLGLNDILTRVIEEQRSLLVAGHRR